MFGPISADKRMVKSVSLLLLFSLRGKWILQTWGKWRNRTDDDYDSDDGVKSICGKETFYWTGAMAADKQRQTGRKELTEN